eukprot:Skav219691  [mRNA]  locus=scaffold817:174458:175250:+ [translate_table: standard]
MPRSTWSWGEGLVLQCTILPKEDLFVEISATKHDAHCKAHKFRNLVDCFLLKLWLSFIRPKLNKHIQKGGQTCGNDFIMKMAEVFRLSL